MNRGLTALALVATLCLAACGTASDPAPAATTTAAVAEIKAGADHNETDVMFLQMLIFHQNQGLQMTTTALKRAKNPELKTLVEAIQATENDELTMMESWLTGQADSVNVDKAPSLHADHGGLPGTGEAEIKALTKVPAADFDKAFLSQFLAHQHQAMEMSKIEATGGRNEEARKLADRVPQSRQGEIQQMLSLMSG